MPLIKKNVTVIEQQAHRKTSMITFDEFSALRKAYLHPLTNGVFMSNGFKTIIKTFCLLA